MLGGAASLAGALVTAAAATVAEPFQCRVCLKRFGTQRGLDTHFGMLCKRRPLDWAATQQQQRVAAVAEDQAASEEDAERRRCAMFASTRMSAVLDDLTRFRYDVGAVEKEIDRG